MGFTKKPDHHSSKGLSKSHTKGYKDAKQGSSNDKKGKGKGSKHNRGKSNKPPLIEKPIKYKALSGGDSISFIISGNMEALIWTLFQDGDVMGVKAQIVNLLRRLLLDMSFVGLYLNEEEMDGGPKIELFVLKEYFQSYTSLHAGLAKMVNETYVFDREDKEVLLLDREKLDMVQIIPYDYETNRVYGEAADSMKKSIVEFLNTNGDVFVTKKEAEVDKTGDIEMSDVNKSNNDDFGGSNRQSDNFIQVGSSGGLMEVEHKHDNTDSVDKIRDKLEIKNDESLDRFIKLSGSMSNISEAGSGNGEKNTTNHSTIAMNHLNSLSSFPASSSSSTKTGGVKNINNNSLLLDDNKNLKNKKSNFNSTVNKTSNNFEEHFQNAGVEGKYGGNSPSSRSPTKLNEDERNGFKGTYVSSGKNKIPTYEDKHALELISPALQKMSIFGRLTPNLGVVANIVNNTRLTYNENRGVSYLTYNLRQWQQGICCMSNVSNGVMGLPRNSADVIFSIKHYMSVRPAISYMKQELTTFERKIHVRQRAADKDKENSDLNDWAGLYREHKGKGSTDNSNDTQKGAGESRKDADRDNDQAANKNTDTGDKSGNVVKPDDNRDKENSKKQDKDDKNDKDRGRKKNKKDKHGKDKSKSRSRSDSFSGSSNRSRRSKKKEKSDKKKDKKSRKRSRSNNRENSASQSRKSAKVKADK